MNGAVSRPRLPGPAGTAEQQEWLRRVDKIAPLLAAHRQDGERNRVTPAVVYEALRDAGIPRMWVSREFGGEQVSLGTGMAVLEELARIDASVAWQMGVQGAIGRLSDYLPEDRARQLFKDNDGLVVGGVKPFGSAERVDGGYRLSGEWSFASGSAHAGWLACMAFLTSGGERVVGPHGPEIVVLFVPKDAVEIRDTWHAIGLRASGSNHYRVADLFVPEDLSTTRTAMARPPRDRPARAYPVSYFDFGPFTTAPVPLGLAVDAIDSFVALARSKVPASGTTVLAAGHTVQDKVGRAEMLVHGARVLLHDAAARTEEAGGTGGDELSCLIRLTGATVSEQAVSVVDTMYDLAGSSSVYETSRLERCFRDVHTATKHIALSSSHFEMAGLYLLGGELAMRR
ncbi:acyl-CoA dehydrogenase [Micromonospora sp. KC207]|uniref:acyl-CoA dehydrogenase family protein n=1 Tax=Micromonospora sp. KC207 TaxID=2530377 RepID=UPI00104E67AC|nr:acyl-CoA dehydrogenase family protein [Micromonospora sp. KC207]TDC52090.1 acyl-CoA dehydrogenase [Micromonospora sp. KC207]